MSADPDILRKMASAERRLRIASACQKFKSTEPWEIIRAALAAEQAARLSEIANPDTAPTMDAVSYLRGCISTCKWLYGLMDVNSAHLDQTQKAHDDLARKVAYLNKLPKPEADAAVASVRGLANFGGDP